MLRKSTIIVLVLFVALVGLALFMQSRPQSSASATPSPSPQPLLLGSLAVEDITGVRMVQEGEETLRLSLGTDQVWRVGAQADTKVDVGKVERLRAELVSVRVIRSLDTQPTDGGLSEFGLEPPAAVLVISTKQGQTITLNTGAQAPTGAGTYVQVVEQTSPVLVSSGAVDAIIAAAQALQAPEALPTLAP